MEFSQSHPFGVLRDSVCRRRLVLATLLDSEGNAFYGILPQQLQHSGELARAVERAVSRF